MRRFFFTLCTFSILAVSTNLSAKTEIKDSRFSEYLTFTKEFPEVFGPTGSWKQNEIEIALAPEKIKEIEGKSRQRLISKGVKESEAKEWTRVGIVAEDNYWIWIRDAVIFPTGALGTYDRLMWKNAFDGPPGAAVMPLTSNKKIVVNVNYRHATRSWEIELPRGARNKGETVENAAKRELREETGYISDQILHLGNLSTDSGVLSGVIPVFLGILSGSGETQQEFSEAIIQNPAFSKEELKEGLSKGYIEVQIKGKTMRAACRDAFLAYALLQAETRGLL